MKLKSGPIPFYYQLETVFRNKIASGEWPVDSKIPNELELSKNYGVSVMTIMKALATLVTEGIISKKRGSGTFVKNISKGEILHPLEGSLTQAIGGMMASTSIKILDYQIIKPPAHAAEKLKINITDNILHFKRMYFFHSSTPFSLTCHHINESIGKHIKEEDLTTTPVTVLIDRHSPVGVGYASQIMRGTIADDTLSDLLSVNVGFPLLKVERTVYSVKNTPLQYVDIYYRADKYIFKAKLKFKTTK